MVEPFLKWAGGKKQLLQQLLKHVPKPYGRYIEPFVGGGALFFFLQPRQAILGDSNEDLMNAYQVVRDDVDTLIKELREYRNEETFFHEVRSRDPKTLNAVQRAARMIFLNKTCYNGLYRVNKKGDFNVPFGKRKTVTICDTANLRAASRALQGVELVCADYKKLLREYAVPGDFVYLDPPYYPGNGYSDFKRYTKEFFYEEDHVELRDEFVRLTEIGCWVLLTNRNINVVRELYGAFEYEIVDTRRNISRTAATRTGQDLIVSATKPKKRTASLVNGHGDLLLDHFPGTRYMGSKYRVLPFISQAVRGLHFRSVLDAFSGSGCVSYMFKQHNAQVISNDFMRFSYHFSKALIQNNGCVLDKDDLTMLLQPNPAAGTFIANTFRGLYFSDDENVFLDSLRANIDLLQDELKRSVALAAATRACLKRRPRGIFTFVGERYDDGRRDMHTDLRQHFIENVRAFNAAVFDNGQQNLAVNSDVFDLDVHADLVYLDPPYYTPNSDNDYTRRYHFVEGFVKNWQGLSIQYETVTRKFQRYETPFIARDTVHDAFDRLFSKFRESILVVSYSSNSLPSKEEMVSMLGHYKKNVRVQQVEHLYSFGNQANKVGNNANRVQEYVFVAY